MYPTEEQLRAYEVEEKQYIERMKAMEPKDKNSKEWREWNMDYHMDYPNKPGYYRANND